jgi:hypothetical protein
MTRSAGRAGWMLAPALLLCACAGGPAVPASETAGSGGSEVQVLVEQAALGALSADIHQFVATRRARVSWGGGTADAIAITVKQGYPIRVVVLPSGPALERVRDELIAPPSRLGTLGSQTYWACPVDRFGLSFVRFLGGRTSQRVLRSQGFDVSSSP